jgi:hypothetical protein
LAELSPIFKPEMVNFEVSIFGGLGVTFGGNLVVSPFFWLFYSLVDIRYQ